VTYLKSALVGIAGALAASVIWVTATLVLPIAAPLLISRISGTEGSGVAGASVGSGSILIAGLVGFVAGFYWQFRKINASQQRP
jgi:hypothetical protein